MTNEELVAMIQAGERDRLPQLWSQVERFVAKRANHVMTMYAAGYMTNSGGIEFDDLYNSGYLALVAAVDTYKPDKGMKFISWFAFFVKTAFGNAGGWKSQKNDALRKAMSLDAPIDGEDDSDPLAQIVEDTGAAQEIQAVEDKIFQEQLHATLEAVRASGKSISDYEATVLLEKYNGNYLAYRTLAEVLHQQGKAKDVVVMQPDAILCELEDAEAYFMHIIDDGSMSLGAELFFEQIPILENMVQRFLDGQYVMV